MKNIVVLTGAGISAESGIQTFRGDDGLWEGHDVMEVASPEGWYRNQPLVLDFYNKRRRQLKTVKPNSAHEALVDLAEKFHVEIVTQNVDDLHERAGSEHVTHLHGELFKVRSSKDPNLILEWKDDLNVGDYCELNSQLRPHVVWFGEQVPMLERGIELAEKADILIIIGTSMQVYPAAGLLSYASESTPIYFIDPEPAINSSERLSVMSEKASIGVPQLVEKLLAE